MGGKRGWGVGNQTVLVLHTAACCFLLSGTDYAPTVKDEKKRAAAAAAAAANGGERRGGYFGAGEDLHADLPPLPAEGEGRGQGEHLL